MLHVWVQCEMEYLSEEMLRSPLSSIRCPGDQQPGPVSLITDCRNIQINCLRLSPAPQLDMINYRGDGTRVVLHRGLIYISLSPISTRNEQVFDLVTLLQMGSGGGWGSNV